MKYIDNSVQKFQDLKRIIAGGFNITKSVAEDIEETEEGKETIKELREIMLQYAKMEQEIKQYSEAAQHAKEKFQNEFSMEKDTVPSLQKLFEDSIKEVNEKSSEDDINKHKEVTNFMETVWSQHYGQNDDGENHEENSDDEILQMTQVIDEAQKYICPITKTELVDPVKSKKCNHTYSRKAIESLIMQRKQKARCPIPGCVHTLTIEDIESNNVVAFEMRKRKKK